VTTRFGSGVPVPIRVTLVVGLDGSSVLICKCRCRAYRQRVIGDLDSPRLGTVGGQQAAAGDVHRLRLFVAQDVDDVKAGAVDQADTVRRHLQE